MSDLLTGIGFILFRQGDCERARSVMEQAIQVRARLKPLPDVGLAKMHFDFGGALLCLGEVEEAVKQMKIALDAYETVYGPEHDTVRMIRSSYDNARETAERRRAGVRTEEADSS